MRSNTKMKLKNKIYRVTMCFYSFLKLLGTRNWHKGIDNPNLYQRLYKWRVSPKLAWELATGIWFDKVKNRKR